MDNNNKNNNDNDSGTVKVGNEKEEGDEYKELKDKLKSFPIILCYSKSQGRFIRSKRKIEKEEIIFKGKAIGISILDSHRKRVCSNCFFYHKPSLLSSLSSSHPSPSSSSSSNTIAASLSIPTQKEDEENESKISNQIESIETNCNNDNRNNEQLEKENDETKEEQEQKGKKESFACLPYRCKECSYAWFCSMECAESKVKCWQSTQDPIQIFTSENVILEEKA
eukprot:TRINITY_DN3352_c0_g1_i2.p1 TRINITY_DN3352_c0_g1~~TRINITY_DN3352_c0_g1_i2.p1  ORF type:complete len:224 (+),score=79.08 TRINITY_DN3352_c0_g1_i2:179-850(+)